jgi:hypothetical protein
MWRKINAGRAGAAGDHWKAKMLCRLDTEPERDARRDRDESV